MGGGFRIHRRRGRQPYGERRQHMILPKFPKKNCMKWRKFGPWRAPLRSATGYIYICLLCYIYVYFYHLPFITFHAKLFNNGWSMLCKLSMLAPITLGHLAILAKIRMSYWDLFKTKEAIPLSKRLLAQK